MIKVSKVQHLLFIGLLTILSIFTNDVANAQISYKNIQNDFLNENISRLQVKKYLKVKNGNFHSAVQPYEFLDTALQLNEDTIFKPAKFNSTLVKVDPKHFSIEPILNLQVSAMEGSELSQKWIGGFRTQINLGKKLFFRASIFAGYVNSQRDSLYWERNKVLNGIAPLQSSGEGYSLMDFNAALTYNPSDIFSLQLGKGKHQYGDGYRSLLLSSNAIAFPYFKIRTNIWKFQYINLFSAHKSYDLRPNGEINYGSKFSASHLLSWNVSNDVNLYFFESIIWQGQDSLNPRGFDINYVNPIIFYRPVEFAIGSSDNAIVGIGGSLKIDKKLQFYAQFVIDEMIFNEFIGRSGWWGNKYGVQMGLKAFDMFKTKDTYFQLEWNQVRPFTYSHGSPKQNYAHFSQALAHPTGSNFYEILGIFTKKKNDFELQVHAQYILKGNDILGQNLGGNIFNSYVNPFINYENQIGQGITVGTLTNRATLAYVFDQKSDGRITLSFQNAMIDIEGTSNYNNTVTLGLNLNM